MKSKLVLWGNNAQDERVLIAMQLRATDNKVDIWLFPEALASPDFSQQMLNEWRNGAEIAFPEGYTYIERELTLADSLLPEDIKVERTDVINRAQTEWQFIVLSTKLHEAYKSELADLDDKVKQLTDYSSDLWDSLKGFWNKVQTQVNDRNLFREHADELRDMTNSLFGELKTKRTAVMNEFEENSKNWYAQFTSVLDTIEKKVEEGINRFPDVFDQLKQAQSQFRDQKLTREHSNDLWNRIDNLFKVVKEKKFGNNAINDNSAADRLTRRFEGLIGAIDKMQQSIDRDKQELDFQRKRVAHSEGQLEEQIRQAKINMISERVRSKEEKMAEMLQTKQEIESKMSNLKERDAKKEKAMAKEAKAQKPASENGTQTAAAPVVEEAKAEAPVVEVAATPQAVVEASSNGHSSLEDVAADAHAALEAVDKV
jgi:hypothetical protein